MYCKTVYFYISSVIALYLQVFVPAKDYKPINPFTKYISRYIIINLKLKKMHYRDKIKFLCVSRDKGSFSTRGSSVYLSGFFSYRDLNPCHAAACYPLSYAHAVPQKILNFYMKTMPTWMQRHMVVLVASHDMSNCPLYNMCTKPTYYIQLHQLHP